MVEIRVALTDSTGAHGLLRRLAALFGPLSTPIFSLTHGAHSLAPWPGGLLFVGYCALTLAIAAVLLVRRDT